MKYAFATVSIFVLFGCAWVQVRGQESEVQLSDYECKVVMKNPRSAEVTVLIELRGVEISDQVTNSFFHYDGEEIGGVHVEDRDGRLVQLIESSRERTIRLAFSASSIARAREDEATYTVHYEVNSTWDDIRRIPLPVPIARAAFGERPVKIEIEIPHGYVVAGDEWPAFVWTDERIGRVRLPGVPSFIAARAEAAKEVSRRSQIFTVGHLADATIVSLIVLGSVIWSRRYRFTILPRQMKERGKYCE